MDRLHGKAVAEPQLDTSQQVHCVSTVSTGQALLQPAAKLAALRKQNLSHSSAQK